MHQFPADIAQIIAEYAMQWTIAPWIQSIEDTMPQGYTYTSDVSRDEIKYQKLSTNLRAEDALRGRTPLWIYISRNSADWALDLLEANQDMIYWDMLSSNTNPRAITLLKQSIEKINWYCLSSNKAAIDILQSTPRKVRSSIQHNCSHRALDLMTNLGFRLEDYALAANSAPWAIKLMQDYGDMSDSMKLYLAANTHPWAIKQLAPLDLSTVGWILLCSNTSAIDILKANPDRISMDIYNNPGIFEPTIPLGLVEILLTVLWP